ncbi:MAG: phosphate ABC transporter permease PstA [Sporichthya sp.]|nr:phosphate ABC transporter permease PstA [Sporichthya sp.]
MVHQRDILALGGSIIAAVSTTMLLFNFLAPWSGKIGFVAVAFGLFLGFYALLVSTEERGPAVRDRVIAALVHGVAFVLLLALVFLIGFTFERGWSALQHWNFYHQDLANAGPLEPMEVGGIRHAAIGTLWMIAIALAITVPLGIACAMFLNETRGAFTRFVRTIVEAMTALPSIVAGLFILATWILILGRGKSGLAAALALSVMMLPIIIRAADVVLRLVPGNLKEASLALGAGQWRTAWHVVLPTSRSGLATAVILGAARGIGETSPVLLTAGYTTYTNTNPLAGDMTSLPLAAFKLVSSPQNSFIARGFGAGATLLALVLILFIAARIIGGRGPGNLTKRQQRRVAAVSQQDLARFARREAGLEPEEQSAEGAGRRLLSMPVVTSLKVRRRMPTRLPVPKSLPRPKGRRRE